MQLAFRNKHFDVPREHGMRSIEMHTAFDQFDMVRGTIEKGPLGDWIGRLGHPSDEDERPGFVHRRRADAKAELIQRIEAAESALEASSDHALLHPISTRNGMLGADLKKLLHRIHELSPVGGSQLLDISDANGRRLELVHWPLRIASEMFALSGWEDMGMRDRTYLLSDLVVAERLAAEWPKDVALGTPVHLRAHPELDPDLGRRVVDDLERGMQP